jgi:dihydroflavonol-4-reductase
MTWLVTGATGLVGNNVARLLLEQGEKVRVLVRKPRDRSLAGLNLEIARGDVRDGDAVALACKGVTHIVHAAALVHIGWHGLMEQQAINVEGTRNVARAALRNGARMVHVSTVDARGTGSADQPATEETPLSETVPCPYVVTKRAAENVIDELVAEGLQATVVNPAYMLGPWDWKPSSGRMLLRIASGWAKVAPPGNNSFCDVREVSLATIEAARRAPAGRRFILAGHSLSYLDAWTIFARIVGVGKPWLTPPGPISMIVASWFGDLKARLFEREGDVNSASIAMLSFPRYYSSARAVSELGYRLTTVEKMTADAWRWFQEVWKR